MRLQSNEVFNNGSVLICSSSLLKENSKVVWNLKKLPDFLLRHLTDKSKFVLAMAQFHNILPSPPIIVKFFVGDVKHGFWQYARAGAEVVDFTVVSKLMLSWKNMHVFFRRSVFLHNNL